MTIGQHSRFYRFTLSLALLCTTVAVMAQGDGPHRLNSVVTELARVPLSVPPEGQQADEPLVTLEIQRPRAGWLHISLTGNAGEADRVWLTLENGAGEETVLEGPGETMRLVDNEPRRLSLWVAGAPELGELVVRAVPEIMFYLVEYLENPQPMLWFHHDRDFLEAHILPHCNMAVGFIKDEYAPFAEHWRGQGRRWFGNQGMALLRNPETDLAAHWAGMLSNPVLDGVIHDELLNTDAPHVERYADQLARLDAVPGMAHKEVYFFGPAGIIGQGAVMDKFLLDDTTAAEGAVSLLCLGYDRRTITLRQVEMQLAPERRYTLSAAFKTEGVARGQYSGIFMINDGWHSTHGSMIQPPEGDSDWQRLTRTFTLRPSSTGMYQLLIVPPAGGRMWVDDIRLELAEDEADGADERHNFVINGGFEQGFAGWPDADRLFGQFVRSLVGTRHRLAPELYLNEQPTLEDAEKAIEARLTATVEAWREQFSGIEQNLLITLSGGNCALRYSYDRNPEASYKVFLDMQLHAIANESAFTDLWGVGFWSAHYLDEEHLRWYGALFRHYLVEGNRERFTNDPYILPHLVNPGFEDGLAGWETHPAAADSISIVPVAEMPGAGRRGTYSAVPQGRQVLRTVRDGDTRNSLAQTIRHLTPGREYSLKVYTTDPDYSAAAIPTRIGLEGVEELPELSRDTVWQVQVGDDNVHWNCHYRVFRALGEEGRLVLEDGAPGEVYWDFVQVEPYFAP